VIAPAVDAWPYGSWYDDAQMPIPRSFVASYDSCDTGPARKRLDGDTRLLYPNPSHTGDECYTDACWGLFALADAPMAAACSGRRWCVGNAVMTPVRPISVVTGT
jgi:hypothetical protein